jgi:hypothetical protein
MTELFLGQKASPCTPENTVVNGTLLKTLQKHCQTVFSIRFWTATSFVPAENTWHIPVFPVMPENN